MKQPLFDFFFFLPSPTPTLLHHPAPFDIQTKHSELFFFSSFDS